MARSGGKNKKKVLGRPTVMTPEIIGKLEESFDAGTPDADACVYAGIAPATLYDYCTKHPDFSERKEMLKEKMILSARQSVKLGIKSDPELALKFLERKRRDEFSTKTETAHSGVKKFIVEFTDEKESNGEK